MSPADPKPPRSRKRPPTPGERADRDQFKHRVLVADGGACVMAGRGPCDGRLEAHHVVGQKQLRAAGRHDLLWAWANGATLCYRHHRRHTLSVEKVALAALPARCVAFAAEHGFDRILARYYTPEAP